MTPADAVADSDQILSLQGYHLSVYTRVVRMVLHEKQLEYEQVEVDPFSPDRPETDTPMHPFGRVPALLHGNFELYETAAIVHYLDAAFPESTLLPRDPQPLARALQVVGIIDSYGYWPMVRQVFSHGMYRPHVGEPSDPTEIEAGLESSDRVLAALEAIAKEGLVLDSRTTTVADCYLAPMFAYFILYSEGQRRAQSHPCLWQWWTRISRRESFAHTDTGLVPTG